ncbi:MAG TPA: diacylglycerol kinase family protein [Treponemataceae bacterium]|nr:diacylglycerol kinase family protein [Treponemataceae bacterium]
MDYNAGFKFLVERASIFTGLDVHVTIIANPVAGGFIIPERARKNINYFNDAIESVKLKVPVTQSCTTVIHQTTCVGHAAKIARSVLNDAYLDKIENKVYLIVTAGGDGTSLDVQAELTSAVFEQNRRELISKVCLLRLPFGTGNDGSDGRTLDDSLRLLTESSVFAKTSAIRVYSEKTPYTVTYAFNIASLGLDAFVTHMTNRVKRVSPGDMYKLWVDIACLFYNRLYKVDTMTVDAFMSDETPVISYSEKLLLQVMGVSGKRTYGSNQKILPDDRNICAAREMSLRRKLLLKKHVREGTHTSFPEMIVFSADRLVLHYSQKILIQFDGEARLLTPADFPLVMELTEPIITILKKS